MCGGQLDPCGTHWFSKETNNENTHVGLCTGHGAGRHGRGADPVEDRFRGRDVGPAGRIRPADEQRRQALPAGTRRRGGRPQDPAHHQGRGRTEPRGGQARRAGTDHPRQGGIPGRLRFYPQRTGRGSAGHRGQGPHGGHERGHVVHHRALALRGADLDDAAAERLRHRRLGAEEQRQDGVFAIRRLRSWPGRQRAVPQDLHGRRRQDRGRSGGAAEESGIRPLHAADQGRQARRRVPVVPLGRAVGADAARLPRARPGAGRHQGAGHRRRHRRHVPGQHGRRGAGPDHLVPLFCRPRFGQEQGLHQGLRIAVRHLDPPQLHGRGRL